MARPTAGEGSHAPLPVDGSKRVGHATVAVFLLLNGVALQSSVDDVERVIVGVAAGALGRDGLLEWLRGAARPTR